MEIGRAYCRATGLGVCGSRSPSRRSRPSDDSDANPLLQLQGSHAPDGGTLAATVSWPQDAAGLDPTDICVVVFDADGGVVRGGDDVVTADPRPTGRRALDGGRARRRSLHAVRRAVPQRRDRHPPVGRAAVPRRRAPIPRPRLGRGHRWGPGRRRHHRAAPGRAGDLAAAPEAILSDPALRRREPVHLVRRRLGARPDDQLVDVDVRRRVATQAIASATSSAVSGSGTPA